MQILHIRYSEEGVCGCKVTSFDSGWLDCQLLVLERETEGRKDSILAGLWVLCFQDYGRYKALTDLGLFQLAS